MKKELEGFFLEVSKTEGFSILETVEIIYYDYGQCCHWGKLFR